jgi:hypothetical protein
LAQSNVGTFNWKTTDYSTTVDGVNFYIYAGVGITSNIAGVANDTITGLYTGTSRLNQTTGILVFQILGKLLPPNCTGKYYMADGPFMINGTVALLPVPGSNNTILRGNGSAISVAGIILP